MSIVGIAWNDSKRALFICVVNDDGEYSIGKIVHNCSYESNDSCCFHSNGIGFIMHQDWHYE